MMRINHRVEDEQLLYQVAAFKIRELGKQLNVLDKVTNTALIYMHTFHRFHSFKNVFADMVAAATIFLACKIHDNRANYLEKVVKVSHLCSHEKAVLLDVKTEEYEAKRDELLMIEQHLLMSIGFEYLVVESPHKYVEQICKFTNANENLRRTALLLTEMSLALTSMITAHPKPNEIKEIACGIFHLACKHNNFKVNLSFDGKEWFFYIEKDLTWKHVEDRAEILLKKLESTSSGYKQRIINDRFPNVDVHDPKIAVAVPKVAVAVPKVTVAVPKVAVAVPKVALHVPKVTVAVPKVVNEAAIQVPKNLKWRAILIDFSK